MKKINIHNEKKELRKSLLSIRMEMSQQEVQHNSNVINKALLKHPLFNRSQVIMVYMPFKNEVDISQFIEEAWRNRKIIVVPKTYPSTHRMEPFEIRGWNDLVKGNFNIFEPVTENQTPFPIDQIDVVLIPGVAFDHLGVRLGYGGGYYDRFFDRFHKLPIRLGISYDNQLVERLPKDEHDYIMSEILTESRRITVK